MIFEKLSVLDGRTSIKGLVLGQLGTVTIQKEFGF